jgi:rhodanese-related sulfurtransferase
MSPEEIAPSSVHEKKLAHPELILIDVRTPDEYAQVHASYAKLIPLDQFEAASTSSPLPANIAKEEEIYLICRSGARSRRAGEILLKFGYKKLFNVTGGTIRWLEEDLPVE